ncbi:MAG: hypothetical protein IJV65_03315, partial [Kiritimatiellae bacterium]|nr:hypothetical protein [Kiritimatiellia bacterium]
RPEEAKWTGYGAGCHGDALARAGLRSLVARVYGAKTEETPWQRAREVCVATIEGKLPDSGGAAAPPESNDTVETDAKGRPIRAGSLKALLARRSAGFVQGLALGGERFLKRVAGSLPKRVRRRAESLFDRCGFLGLKSAAGVREAS